jgi:penicillin-binding protein 2
MDEYRVRAGLFGTLILLVLVILGGRLAWLQLFDREAYASEATNNAVREILVRPARGAIYDRNGNLMVDNATTFSISITPRYFGRDPRDRKAYDTTEVRLLASLLEVPDSVVWNGLAKAIARNPDAPTPVFKEVPSGGCRKTTSACPAWSGASSRRAATSPPPAPPMCSATSARSTGRSWNGATTTATGAAT